MSWNLHQVDVNIAFLNGVIEEEVYIKQPKGFETHGKESHICILKKYLYGLKKSPRAQYSRIDGYLTRLGFSKSDTNQNIYIKVEKNELVILLLYVYDLSMAGAKNLIVQCKRDLAFEFGMKYLVLMHYYLGLEVSYKPNKVFFSQRKYIIN